MTSRPGGLSFYGLDALSLSLLIIAGITADKKLERKKIINILISFSVVTNISSWSLEASSFKCSLFNFPGRERFGGKKQQQHIFVPVIFFYNVNFPLPPFLPTKRGTKQRNIFPTGWSFAEKQSNWCCTKKIMANYIFANLCLVFIRSRENYSSSQMRYKVPVTLGKNKMSHFFHSRFKFRELAPRRKIRINFKIYFSFVNDTVILDYNNFFGAFAYLQFAGNTVQFNSLETQLFKA